MHSCWTEDSCCRKMFQSIIIVVLLSGVSCVNYLAGVPRFGRDTFDHYFSCNADGPSLIWGVNGSAVSEFLGGRVSKVINGATSSFNYTAALLSSKLIGDMQYTLDSVSIVSLSGSTALNVSCQSGTASSYAMSTQSKMRNVINESSTHFILEEYVLSDVIVRDSNYNHTSIFICRVSKDFMYWETGTDTIGFSSSDSIGKSRGNLQENEDTVSRQAALIAKDPYNLVSVFFVTARTDITVVCGYPENEAQITSNCQLAYEQVVGPVSTETTNENLDTSTHEGVTKAPAIVGNVESTTDVLEGTEEILVASGCREVISPLVVATVIVIIVIILVP